MPFIFCLLCSFRTANATPSFLAFISWLARIDRPYSSPRKLSFSLVSVSDSRAICIADFASLAISASSFEVYQAAECSVLETQGALVAELDAMLVVNVTVFFLFSRKGAQSGYLQNILLDESIFCLQVMEFFLSDAGELLVLFEISAVASRSIGIVLAHELRSSKTIMVLLVLGSEMRCEKCDFLEL
jgi:hypothetical protein